MVKRERLNGDKLKLLKIEAYNFLIGPKRISKEYQRRFNNTKNSSDEGFVHCLLSAGFLLKATWSEPSARDDGNKTNELAKDF